MWPMTAPWTASAGYRWKSPKGTTATRTLGWSTLTRAISSMIRARMPDFSDARYMGIAKWVDVETAIEMAPDMERELRNVSGGLGPDGYLDGRQRQ
jgi:hypothetical protein